MRGDARTELTYAPVAALSQAAAEVLGGAGFAVGADTRESGPELASAIHAGIQRAGGSSVDLGVLPTPAVALWCAQRHVAGAMVSASHNPWHDNGVKFFAPGGSKLGDEVQDRIQDRFEGLLGGEVPAPAAGEDRHSGAAAAHVAAVVTSVETKCLAGMRVVIDCANGAASEVAPEALRSLGAEVVVTHAEPNGRNINDGCGSTHPESLQARVRAEGAHAGLAFDGDADRLLAVDHTGALVDGDEIIAICALDAHVRGELKGNAVVVTVMTNLGFRRSMASAGIQVVDTRVGDRYVLEALDARGLGLGGEQSGHVIFRELAATGDGLLTGVQLLAATQRAKSSLASLAAAAMTRLPQVLQNVRVTTLPDDVEARIAPLVEAAEMRLGDRGRILIRPSGTEPLIRVMVEAETDSEAAMEADALSAAVTRMFG
jgi:phosphoglucosamine mutase